MHRAQHVLQLNCTRRIGTLNYNYLNSTHSHTEQYAVSETNELMVLPLVGCIRKASAVSASSCAARTIRLECDSHGATCVLGYDPLERMAPNKIQRIEPM